jgi:tRNA pseudouridine55 synthase
LNKIGFLNLNKPAGFTSHDCVAKIRRILDTQKVGHGGTLDPAATGVLPIAIGKATRLLQFLPTLKAYQAKIRLGITTTSDDLEGEIITSKSTSNLTLAQIEACLPQFIGTIEQSPPAYSAIKKNGKKLYELARKGEIIEVPKRQVTIYQIDILNWYPSEFSELELTIICGSGTYIRAIARDLGKILNVGGSLAALKRTLSCGMELKDSLTLEKVEQQQQTGNLNLIPPDFPLKHYPQVFLKEEAAKRWCQGQKIIYNQQLNQETCLVYNEEKVFLGIAKLRLISEQIFVMPQIVF